MVLEKWHEEFVELRDIIDKCLQRILRGDLKLPTTKTLTPEMQQYVQKLRQTQMEQEVLKALGKLIFLFKIIYSHYDFVVCTIDYTLHLTQFNYLFLRTFQ